MSKKLSSTSSIMKQLPKENIYNNIKSPIDIIKKKESGNKDLHTQISNFQKEPNTNFMSSLQNRIPTNANFQIQKPVDYGLTKDLVSKGKFSLDNSGITSSLLNKRISNNGTFKQSKGIPSLNAHFNRFMPKDLDYRYVDPQTYEYKLKGMTQDKLIRNAMQEEGTTMNDNNTVLDPNDPKYYANKALQMREQKALEETLHPTTQYKKWREQALADKATKIQKVFRGHNDRQNIKEGIKELPEESSSSSSSSSSSNKISDVIEVGKAKRKAVTDEYNKEQAVKNIAKEEKKRAAIDTEKQTKFESFHTFHHPNLTKSPAVKLFADSKPAGEDSSDEK